MLPGVTRNCPRIIKNLKELLRITRNCCELSGFLRHHGGVLRPPMHSKDLIGPPRTSWGPQFPGILVKSVRIKKAEIVRNPMKSRACIAPSGTTAGSAGRLRALPSAGVSRRSQEVSRKPQDVLDCSQSFRGGPRKA